MRWRVLMNALERSGARDTVERLSLAVEQIGPIVAVGLIVPSAIMLAALGAYAGFRLGTGQSSVVFMGLRIVLFTMCVFAVAGPLLMPSAERPNAVRLLLLPIPRRTLYLVQAFAAVSDPWMIVGIPAALAVAAGLAASGAFSAALIAAIAGLLFIVCLIGLSALATLLFQLVVRDRRRGELIALLFIVVIPAAAMLPGLFGAQRTREERQAARRRAKRAAMIRCPRGFPEPTSCRLPSSLRTLFSRQRKASSRTRSCRSLDLQRRAASFTRSGC